MKKIIITIVLFCAVSMSALAQNTITMKFTGRNQNNEWIPLSSVLVENQTQRWQELVYYPDTILYMGTVGIDDYMQSEKVHLFQNVPNPFDGVTDFSLQLDEDQNILLEIYDMNGKLVAQYENSLPQGPHLFRTTLISPQTYLLSAKTENDRMHIKMVNKGNGGANTIEYLGQGSIQYELKSDSKGSSPYPFVAGDWMKYVGYANLCGTEYVSTPVEQNQTQSETVNLVFTLPVPTVITNAADNITASSARLNGDANGQGYTLTERGFYYGSSNSSMTEKVVSNGTGDGAYASFITDLNPGSTYYFKAYAKSPMGTAYGQTLSVQTLATYPTVNTGTISDIMPTSAIGQGNVVSNNGATVTERGLCWSSTTQFPTLTNANHVSAGTGGNGNYSCSMTGLMPTTTYYVRAYATNSEGTAYGNTVSFTTLAPTLATITTTAVSSITSTSATSGGNITDDGGASVTARGVCWSTSLNPTISNSHTSDGSGTGSFTSSMTGLTSNTTYYVRAYATNSVGTAYGEQKSFTSPFTCGTSTVSDHEGNVYHTVQIGCQCWTKENMRCTTSPSTGTTIFSLSGQSCTGKKAYYVNGDSSNTYTYGLLYNWNAAVDTFNTAYGETSTNTSSSNAVSVTFSGNRRGICPQGWHVPIIAEWQFLADYVGSLSAYQCDGNPSNIAKALASTMGWNSSTTSCAVGNNPSSNNATGFTAVPAGMRSHSFGDRALFWSADQTDSSAARTSWCIDNEFATILYGSSSYKYGAYSVRCLRDVSSNMDDGQPCQGAATVTDYDGNTYNTVQIGQQCWMKQNLKTTHYSDGTSISLGSSTTSTSTAYRYYPNNSSSNVSTYGYLYNWKAVMRNSSSSSSNPSGVQGICPTGWHVPSDVEWMQLTNYVICQSAYQCGGNSTNIAKALASTTDWNNSTNTCAVGNTPSTNNATGFSAVPAGYYYGSYSSFGYDATFWSATQYGSYGAYRWDLTYYDATVVRNSLSKYYGFSVRCLRD